MGLSPDTVRADGVSGAVLRDPPQVWETRVQSPRLASEACSGVQARWLPSLIGFIRDRVRARVCGGEGVPHRA